MHIAFSHLAESPSPPPQATRSRQQSLAQHTPCLLFGDFSPTPHPVLHPKASSPASGESGRTSLPTKTAGSKEIIHEATQKIVNCNGKDRQQTHLAGGSREDHAQGRLDLRVLDYPRGEVGHSRVHLSPPRNKKQAARGVMQGDAGGRKRAGGVERTRTGRRTRLPACALLLLSAVDFATRSVIFYMYFQMRALLLHVLRTTCAPHAATKHAFEIHTWYNITERVAKSRVQKRDGKVDSNSAERFVVCAVCAPTRPSGCCRGYHADP